MESIVNRVGFALPLDGSREDISKSSVRVRYRAISEHLCCDLDGEAVILSLRNGKYYGLNEIGSAIWAMVLEPVSFKQIEISVLEQFDVDPEVCRAEISEFLSLLTEEGLVNLIDDADTNPNQHSGE